MQANGFRHDQFAVRECLFSQATGHTNLVECKRPPQLALRGPLLFGVADGTRTHDDRNHNPGLYQLSYSHRSLEL